MSWTTCTKCKGGLEWGDLYCCHCGAENPQGKKDYENHAKESEQLKDQEQESVD